MKNIKVNKISSLEYWAFYILFILILYGSD